MLSKHTVAAKNRNELICNSSGNARSQLSQLPEPLWTDPGIKSGIRECKLISTGKANNNNNNKSTNGKWFVEPSLKILICEE